MKEFLIILSITLTTICFSQCPTGDSFEERAFADSLYGKCPCRDKTEGTNECDCLGHYKFYNINDDIWLVGDFKGRILWNGKRYVYNEDGILIQIEIYENGCYQGDEKLNE